MSATSIQEVILALDTIVTDSMKENDPAGYFAALYRKVTIRVRDGIANREFEDNDRMEKLDVIFANRYLEAYEAWKKQGTVTASWQKAFGLTTHYWPIVLQHLLIGMNAHINLDLGIAAATVSKGADIDRLQIDFNRINTILSSLVEAVQADLAAIWPRLKWILQKTGKADDFLVDFSMQLSRDGAWQFATSLAAAPDSDWSRLIGSRDTIIAEKSKIITRPGFIPSLIFGIIRLGERGTVSEKIEMLSH